MFQWVQLVNYFEAYHAMPRLLEVCCELSFAMRRHVICPFPSERVVGPQLKLLELLVKMNRLLDDMM